MQPVCFFQFSAYNVVNQIAKTLEFDQMTTKLNSVLNDIELEKLFPAEKADHFFDALYGDISEGAYDIKLAFRGSKDNSIDLAFELHRRNGKCLACNLTYGLPEVFKRHPVINIKGIVEQIDVLLAGQASCDDWQIGATAEITPELHIIPFTIHLK